MAASVDKEIHVQYFALLREQRGLGDETVTTSARTAEQLYEELQGRYGFNLTPEVLRVAINGSFQSWQSDLNDQDQVVFIQPVAGG